MNAKLKLLVDETAKKIVEDTEDCLLSGTAVNRTAKRLEAFANLVIAEMTEAQPAPPTPGT